jgi:hypothetical protein
MQRKILVQHIFSNKNTTNLRICATFDFLNTFCTLQEPFIARQNTNVVFLFIKAYSDNIALMQNSEMLGVLVSKAEAFPFLD